jgi:hypothetical protein
MKDNECNCCIQFIEWVFELSPPEYSGDIRRRFTPQIKINDNDEQLWIETKTFSIISNPKFYTTKEVYEMWLAQAR